MKTQVNWNIRYGNNINDTLKTWAAIDKQVKNLFNLVHGHMYEWMATLDLNYPHNQDEVECMDQYLIDRSNDWASLRQVIDDKYDNAGCEEDLYDIQAFVEQEVQCISDALNEALHLM